MVSAESADHTDRDGVAESERLTHGHDPLARFKRAGLTNIKIRPVTFVGNLKHARVDAAVMNTESLSFDG